MEQGMKQEFNEPEKTCICVQKQCWHQLQTKIVIRGDFLSSSLSDARFNFIPLLVEPILWHILQIESGQVVCIQSKQPWVVRPFVRLHPRQLLPVQLLVML